jgi:hypothetical protein
MVMKKYTLILGALVICSGIAFTSCKKRETKKAEEPDKETETVQDNATMETISNDLASMGSQLAETGNLTEYRSGSIELAMAPCATVSGVGTGTITVDFGSTGCVGKDGRTRTGKLFFDISGSTPTTSVYYRNPGFRVNISGQNYVVDGYQVTINNKSIANTTTNSIPTGTNPGVNLTWSVSANISVVKPNNAGTVTWVCNRTKELINTNDPNCYKGQTLAIDWSKALVRINGTASGTNARGESYSVIAVDLERDFTCTPSALQPYRHPFIKGKLNYTPGTRPTRYFDYGNGGCDFNATVTINGVTYAITLP